MNSKKIITSVEVIEKITEQLNNNVKISLENNADIFSELMIYLNTLHNFRTELKEFDQSIILEEIVYDMICSFNNAANGLYRVANMCNRSIIELGVAFLYFFDNNYKFMLWKQNNYDLRWSELTSEENGVISHKYFNLFCNANNDDISDLINEVIQIYHFSSEYIHGKYNFMQSIEGTKIVYSVQELDSWSSEFKKIGEMLCTLLVIRFGKQLCLEQSNEVDFYTTLLKKRRIEGVI